MDTNLYLAETPALTAFEARAAAHTTLCLIKELFFGKGLGDFRF